MVAIGIRSSDLYGFVNQWILKLLSFEFDRQVVMCPPSEAGGLQGYFWKLSNIALGLSDASRVCCLMVRKELIKSRAHDSIYNQNTFTCYNEVVFSFYNQLVSTCCNQAIHMCYNHSFFHI